VELNSKENNMSKGGVKATVLEIMTPTCYKITTDGELPQDQELQILFDVADVHDCDTKTNRVERNIYTGKWFVDVTPQGRSTEVLYITHCPFCGVKL
jgi:hypothetical protein